ncbi:MAG: MBL fold metallo-hydrolase [Candidatus Angelobacter sp.]
MRIIPLGTSGFFPTQTRETCCILLHLGREAILLDAGTGVKWLGADRVKAELAGTESLHVVLTHLHHDHLCGLTWLLQLWRGELTFWVPVEPLVEVNGLKALDLLTGPPYFSLPLGQWPQRPNLRPLRSGLNNVANIELETMPQRHKGGSAGIRVDTFGYVTDTEPSASHRSFLNGVSFLTVDSMFDRSAYAAAAGEAGTKDHGSGETSARLAADVGAVKLGLIHLNPTFEEDRISNVLYEAQQVFPSAELLVEGDEYEAQESEVGQ